MSRKPADHPDAAKLLNEVKANGKGTAYYMQCDVTNRDMVFRVFDEAVAKMGGLDGLVNCAALPQDPSLTLENCTKEDAQKFFESHILGTFWTNQAALKHMKEKGGSIVDFASYAGVLGLLGDAVYGVMKGGICSFVRNAAMEWGKYGVRINNHCPATSETELAEHFHNLLPPDELEVYAAGLRARVPLKIDTKYGTPTLKMISDTNVFLVSDLSAGITGQIISCDGGVMFTR
jgi:NAD(P)-dependent dehydrogenase (short-subunit alcohol dehydrogenase family)